MPQELISKVLQIGNSAVNEFSPRIALKDIKLYNDTNFMINDFVESAVEVKTILKVHFGLRDVQDDKILAIVLRLQRSYPNLTFNQLTDIFLESDVEKKAYLEITPTEFCSYIDRWEAKRKRIKATLEILAKEEAEKEAKKKDFLEFKAKCDKVYKDSIKAGKWTGDHFEAMYLLKNGKNVLPKDIRDDLYRNTYPMYQDYLKKSKLVLAIDLEDNGFLLTRDHLYANLAMEKIFSEEWHLK